MSGPDRPAAAPAVDPSLLGVDGAIPGHVYLVGGGPGDPGLLTVRAAALLATADLVAYDRLAPHRALALAGADARVRCVGKTPGQRSWSQPAINRLIIAAARRGEAVVRLKGGDPFVLGRGGEEALACRDAGVPVETVSGVTSAVAAPAAAGIPVTHRGLATGVAVVTGHEAPDKPASQLDWEALARFPGTLVFLMGVGRLERITDRLVAHGLPASTPAALIRWATTDRQAVATGDLTTIADEVARAGLGPPATIVVGEVVTCRDRLLETVATATPRRVPAGAV